MARQAERVVGVEVADEDGVDVRRGVVPHQPLPGALAAVEQELVAEEVQVDAAGPVLCGRDPAARSDSGDAHVSRWGRRQLKRAHCGTIRAG